MACHWLYQSPPVQALCPGVDGQHKTNSMFFGGGFLLLVLVWGKGGISYLVSALILIFMFFYFLFERERQNIKLGEKEGE